MSFPILKVYDSLTSGHYKPIMTLLNLSNQFSVSMNIDLMILIGSIFRSTWD